MQTCLTFLALVLVLSCVALQVSEAARLPRDTEEEEVTTILPRDDPAEEKKPVTDEPKKSKSEEKKTKENGYTSRFDNIDIDQILKSKRLINNYFKCLMDLGPCTPDATELKRVLPDALESDCSKCSEKQREGSDKVIVHIIRNEPDMWKQLKAKYDPENKYETRYKNFVKDHGIEEA